MLWIAKKHEIRRIGLSCLKERKKSNQKIALEQEDLACSAAVWHGNCVSRKLETLFRSLR